MKIMRRVHQDCLRVLALNLEWHSPPGVLTRLEPEKASFKRFYRIRFQLGEDSVVWTVMGGRPPGTIDHDEDALLLRAVSRLVAK